MADMTFLAASHFDGPLADSPYIETQIVVLLFAQLQY